MDELGRLAGATVEWRGRREDRRVSVEFANLNLRDAVARVLGTHNYLLVVERNEGGKYLRRIVILSPTPGGPENADSFPPPVQAPSPHTPNSAHSRVVGGPLSPARPAAGFGQVEPAFASVFADTDPAVR
jgi:hypothetical protein